MQSLDETPVLQRIAAACWREEGVRSPAHPGGLAWALKMRTIAYARGHGFRQIRTWNNTMNRPILNINEALGFAKQPVWITFQKDLAPEADR